MSVAHDVSTEADAVFHAVFGHAGPWTEEDYFAIPEVPTRIELVSGVLVISPLPPVDHQRLVGRLTTLFDSTAPNRGWEAFPGLNLRLWPDHVRCPDVIVVRAQLEGRVVSAADALLAVEITSPSNFRQDRITKHGEYAEAGIPFYVRVDLHLGLAELTASAFELVDGTYREYASAPDGVLRLEKPWPLEVDLRAMASGHRPG